MPSRARGVAVDLETYIRNEAASNKLKTKEAEQFPNWANRLLVEGDPEQARRAFTTVMACPNTTTPSTKTPAPTITSMAALVGPC